MKNDEGAKVIRIAVMDAGGIVSLKEIPSSKGKTGQKAKGEVVYPFAQGPVYSETWRACDYMMPFRQESKEAARAVQGKPEKR